MSVYSPGTYFSLVFLQELVVCAAAVAEEVGAGRRPLQHQDDLAEEVVPVQQLDVRGGILHFPRQL